MGKLLILQFITAILLVLIDRLTKLWAVESLKYVGKIPIIEDVFNLRFVENTGAAFSIFRGQTAFLIIIPIIACIIMIYVLVAKKIKSRTGTWGIALILAGAIGNLIDRIFRAGRVVDMFDFELINFPVFNVADICVTVGAVFLFVYIIFFYDIKSEKKDE